MGGVWCVRASYTAHWKSIVKKRNRKMSAVTAAHKHNEGSRQNTEYVAHKRTSEDSAAAKTSSSLGIFTVPNFISFLRLCLVPVFIWLLVGKHNYVAAFVLLMIIGISDWADG